MSNDDDTRPDVDDVAEFARWLVNKGKWSVIGTNTSTSTPFTYPVSYTDDDTGSRLFYLSTLDPVEREVTVDVRASFTVSEAYINGCEGADTQSPTCSKITLSGELRNLPAGSKDEARARKALFKAYPAFNAFPRMNQTFSVYRLEIEAIFLVSKSAPPRDLTVEAYLDAE
ncbi:protein CREG2-like [Salvia hispanica]|uniref:protein CREG2-like n=1 Tax=Salvia hispanica TaxID=49212 RepID=UPI0020097D1D|nr:protein CREG2-like [Salvia hispanica]